MLLWGFFVFVCSRCDIVVVLLLCLCLKDIYTGVFYVL